MKKFSRFDEQIFFGIQLILILFSIFFIFVMAIKHIEYNKIYNENKYISNVNNCLILYNNNPYDSCNCFKNLPNSKIKDEEYNNNLNKWYIRNC